MNLCINIYVYSSPEFMLEYNPSQAREKEGDILLYDVKFVYVHVRVDRSNALSGPKSGWRYGVNDYDLIMLVFIKQVEPT